MIFFFNDEFTLLSVFVVVEDLFLFISVPVSPVAKSTVLSTVPVAISVNTLIPSLVACAVCFKKRFVIGSILEIVVAPALEAASAVF